MFINPPKSVNLKKQKRSECKEDIISPFVLLETQVPQLTSWKSRYSNCYLIFWENAGYQNCCFFNTPTESVSLCSKVHMLHRESWCLRGTSQHARILKNEVSSKKYLLHSPDRIQDTKEGLLRIKLPFRWSISEPLIVRHKDNFWLLTLLLVIFNCWEKKYTV